MTYPADFVLQKYHVVCNLVRRHSVEELTDRIKNGKFISKNTVVSDSECLLSYLKCIVLNYLSVIRKAEDPDIVATSYVMSLKDPVSTLRISIPCRSTVCNHNQCFDAASFLQLQEQAPTWICPVCNKTVSFEALVVDQ